MKKETKKMICEALLAIKKEQDKCHELYKLGVDLINYEEVHLHHLIKCLAGYFEHKNAKDEIEWWLYEHVKKIYYKAGTNKILKNVEKVEDFVNYLNSYKNSKRG